MTANDRDQMKATAGIDERSPDYVAAPSAPSNGQIVATIESRPHEATEPASIDGPPTVQIISEISSSFTYASHQNAIPVIQSIILENQTDRHFESCTLEMSASPAFLRAKTWRVDRLAPGDHLTISDRKIEMDPAYLAGLNEAERGEITLTLSSQGEALHQVRRNVRLLARDEWGGVADMAQLLPAFVMPNDPAIAGLLRTAAERLIAHGHPGGLDGYQSGDPQRAYMLAASIYSAVAGLVLAFLTYFAGAPLIVVPGAFIVGALGMPRWVVSFRRNLRVKAFLKEFPNALDIIVRAIKSGLPLNDGIRLIANESPEPVKTEFRRIVDSQQMGISIPDAALRMQETMPCPEASFFGIVIQIQAQAGGNLSEALGNLSRVLRDRKKMKDRVAALSMEAKASAAIIAALPFAVMIMVYLTTPDYIMPLFTTTTGHIILGCAGVWMSIGILIMRNMMNFEV